MRAVCLGVTLAAGAASAHAAEWQKALAAPLSPGSVALLVEHRNEPGVRERWAAALKGDRPEVRAAAARVIHVSGSTWLVPELLTALARETDAGAAHEELRAVGSLGGASSVDALLAAAARLRLPTVDAVAETLGRTRGADAFGHLAALRSASLSPTGYELLARTAIREGAAAVARGAMIALRETDVQAWNTVLDEARRTGSPVGPGLLIAGLGMEAPRFRALTYWHLAREADRGIAPSSDIAAALGSTPEATGQEPGDLDARFAFEILQRTQGRPPKEVGGWLARARAADRRVIQSPFGDDDPMLKRLTGAEREAVLPAGTKAGNPPPRPKPSPGTPEPVIRMVTRFPRRFAADLIAVSGCAAGPHAVAGALMKYGRDGRPAQISIADSGLAGGCLEAGRALLLSTLAPLGDTTPSVFVVVPLAPDVLACNDEDASPDQSTSATGGAGVERVGARLPEPKKLVNVPPVYPEAARNAHVDGTVILETTISRSGCVSDISVLRSVPLLDVAAMIAVARWRYTPTLLDGRPVPVIMTITVNFRLSPLMRGT